MDNDIPAYLINIPIPAYLVFILYGAGFKRFGALKCQHGVADTTRPPHFVM